MILKTSSCKLQFCLGWSQPNPCWPAGMSAITEKQLGEAEKKFVKYEAMIKSMTTEERQNPDLLAVSSSRRRRVARGSGHKEGEVGELVAVFLGMRKQAGVLSQRMKMLGGDFMSCRMEVFQRCWLSSTYSAYLLDLVSSFVWGLPFHRFQSSRHLHLCAFAAKEKHTGRPAYTSFAMECSTPQGTELYV